MSMSKIWKNRENTGNFMKIKKPKMWVLVYVIRKSHMEYQYTRLLEIPNNRGELKRLTSILIIIMTKI